MERFIFFVKNSWKNSNRKIKTLFFLSFTLFLFTTLLRISAPIIFSYSLKYISDTPSVLFLLVIIYPSLFFFLRLIEEIRFVCYILFEQFFQKDLYNIIQNSYFSLSFSKARDKPSTEYSIIIDRGLDGIRSTLYNGVFSLIPLIVETFILVLITAFKVDIYLSLFILVLLLCFIYFTAKISKTIDKLNQIWYKTASVNYNIMSENIKAFEVIRSFEKKHWAINRYDNAMNIFIGQVKKSAFPNIYLGVIQGILLFTLIGVSTYKTLMLDLDLTNKVSMLVLVNGLILQITFPLLQFSANYKMFIQGLSSSKQLFDFLSLPQISNKISHTLQDNANGIVTNNLSIKFNDEKSISYKNIYIPNNQVTLIEGPSGVGKSTLVKIIAGLMEYNGSIQSNYSTNDIYYLNQRVDIFDTSLEENVALNSTYDLKKIRESLILSGFSESEIETLQQRDLGEQGANISGGQAQRVGIARMIYHDAKVMILDEPTAGLDKIAVQSFISSIKEASKNRTCIIITHDSRLKSISNNTILLE